MTRDLDPPITPEERALAAIGCKAAWDAHFRFGLPWPGHDGEDEQHLQIVEMVAALRAMLAATDSQNLPPHDAPGRPPRAGLNLRENP